MKIQTGRNPRHGVEVFDLIGLIAHDKGAVVVDATLGRAKPVTPPKADWEEVALRYEDGRKVTVEKPPEPPPVDPLLGRKHRAECYDQMDDTGRCVCQ